MLFLSTSAANVLALAQGGTHRLADIQATLSSYGQALAAERLPAAPVREFLDMIRFVPMAPIHTPAVSQAAVAYLKCQGLLSPESHEVRRRVSERPHYRLRRHLGRGCFSEVHLAYEEDTRVHVAMKIHRPPFESRNVNDVPLRGLFNEIRFQAAVDAAPIVPLLRAGLWMGARPFAAYEFQAGGNLEGVVQKMSASRDPGPLASLALAERILQAVATVHGQGILHNDLSLQNLLTDDSGGSVRLSDFGLARRVTEPPYPFETIFKPRNPLKDFQDDVFQLGKILFQIFTRAPRGISDVQVRRNPSARTRRPDLEIPPSIEEMIVRALTARPEGNYADAREMYDEFCLKSRCII